MTRRAITTDGAPRPAGGYSQAIVAGGQVWVAGQVGIDPATGERRRARRPRTRRRQALANIEAILVAAGAGLGDLVERHRLPGFDGRLRRLRRGLPDDRPGPETCPGDGRCIDRAVQGRDPGDGRPPVTASHPVARAARRLPGRRSRRPTSTRRPSASWRSRSDWRWSSSSTRSPGAARSASTTTPRPPSTRRPGGGRPTRRGTADRRRHHRQRHGSARPGRLAAPTGSRHERRVRRHRVPVGDLSLVPDRR